MSVVSFSFVKQSPPEKPTDNTDCREDHRYLYVATKLTLDAVQWADNKPPHDTANDESRAYIQAGLYERCGFGLAHGLGHS